MEDNIKKYTQKEILEHFKICRQTLNNWRRRGTIKYEKVNQRKFLYYLPDTKIIQEDESSKNL
jgi:predicted site-specific integrase-resolvase